MSTPGVRPSPDGAEAPADLEDLPWRRWGVPCCPGGVLWNVWGDGRGDNVAACSVCGKRWRYDSSD
jgi:hypothetical protein